MKKNLVWIVIFFMLSVIAIFQGWYYSELVYNKDVEIKQLKAEVIKVNGWLDTANNEISKLKAEKKVAESNYSDLEVVIRQYIEQTQAQQQNITPDDMLKLLIKLLI